MIILKCLLTVEDVSLISDWRANAHGIPGSAKTSKRDSGPYKQAGHEELELSSFTGCHRRPFCAPALLCREEARTGRLKPDTRLLSVRGPFTEDRLMWDSEKKVYLLDSDPRI
jgi:hypothetical protein